MAPFNKKRVLAVACPTCAARPGENCVICTGVSVDPHRERQSIAADLLQHPAS
jgi:hypothetical protein